jgi:hypothetical protein
MKLKRLAALAALLPVSPFVSCGASIAPEQVSPPELNFDALSDEFAPEAAWRHLRALAEIGPRVSGSLAAAEARGYLELSLVRSGAKLVAGTAPLSPPESAAVTPPAAVAEAPAASEAAATSGAAAVPETPNAAGEKAAIPSPPATAAASAPTEKSAPKPPGDAIQTPDPINVIAEIPGESSQDYLLLMAPYDSRAIPGIRFVGVNDGASGAAVLLEIARVIGRKPLPYTLRLLFTDGDVDPDGTLSLRGSRAYAAGSKADGSLARTRLAVQVNRVCDTDLHIARDLLSHRQYRESFWDAALRLGLADHFEQASFESPKAGHHALRALGFIQVVSLQDTSFGGGEAPGAFANSEQDDLSHCAPESLEIAGRVMLDGLRAIAAQLHKIDRYAATPLAQFREQWAVNVGAPRVVLPASPQPPGAPAAAQ